MLETLARRYRRFGRPVLILWLGLICFAVFLMKSDGAQGAEGLDVDMAVRGFLAVYPLCVFLFGFETLLRDRSAGRRRAPISLTLVSLLAGAVLGALITAVLTAGALALA